MPRATLAVAGDTAFDDPHVIVTVAFAVLDASATLVAVTVKLAGFGTVSGALYVTLEIPPATPFVVTVPTVAFPPAIALTLHVTAADGDPEAVTVATNSCAPPAGTLAFRGEIATTMSSCSVTVADAVAPGEATLTAVTVTVVLAGSAAGAVYNPLAVIVPAPALPPAWPSTSHATSVFDVPVTLA